MFCSSCGLSVKDDVSFCPNCGKSIQTGEDTNNIMHPENLPNTNQSMVFTQNIYSGENNTRKMNFPLINLSSKLFYPFLEISMWFTLIVGAIAGGVFGAKSSETPELGAIIGVLFGVLFMLFWVINICGVLSIFLKIKENTEEIMKKK